MRRTVFVAIVLSTGCKAPIEAPEEVDALSAYLMANWDTEDEEVLAAGVQNLDTFLAAADMTADLNDRTVTLSVLENENLGGLVQPEGIDPALQIPVAVWGLSAHEIDAHVELVSDPNQICIASDSTVYQGREFTSDLVCWESGECRRLETFNEVRTETALADVWLDMEGSFRRVLLEDGRDALLGRGYMPQQYIADNGSSSWDQRYTLDVWIPTDGGTFRYYAMWSSVTLGGVGDDVYANLVKSGVQEYYDNTDAWISGEECNNPRDREYDRP
jgi:hypothetical protein